MMRLARLPWRWWRRIVQLALLAAFLWLFRITETGGSGVLTGWENIFFRTDPLVGGAAVLGGAAAKYFWPALVVLGLTALLGRFFCGWICPLGTLLDAFQWLKRKIRIPRSSLESKAGRRGRRRKQAGHTQDLAPEAVAIEFRIGLEMRRGDGSQ